MTQRTAEDPADLRLVVAFLRSLRRWTQEELARASGVDRSLISDYELGIKRPKRDTLRRLAAGAGLPYRSAERLLPVFRTLRLSLGDAPAAAEDSEDPAEGLDQVLLDAVLPRLAPHLMELEALPLDDAVPAGDRRAAAALWESLRKLSPGRQRLAVERDRRYWTWELAERLCEESARSAARRADEAAALARLGLRVAELSPGSGAWRSRLLGWVWAFVGSALRTQGDLPAAEEAFQRSDRLWEEGAAADPGLLDGARRLALKG